MTITKYLNIKARAFVVFLFGLISLGVLIISTLITSVFVEKWYGVIIGIVLMLVAIPFHISGKKHPFAYIISFLLNSVGNGFSVSALYTSGDIKSNILTLFIAVIPSVAILLLVYLMLAIFSKSKKATISIACVLNAVLTVALTVFWIKYGLVLYSFGFFASLISFFFLCVYGITVNHEERPLLRDISFGGFGSFIIITVVVLFILSEGDIIDGLDVSDIGGGGKKKKADKLDL